MKKHSNSHKKLSRAAGAGKNHGNFQEKTQNAKLLKNKIPIPQKPFNNHYPTFDKVYGKPGSTNIPLLPLTDKAKRKEEEKLLKPGISMAKAQIRGEIKCRSCGKSRLIFSQKQPDKKGRDIMEQICEEAHFSCGSKLFDDADPQYEHLKQFNFGIDRRKRCDDPLESAYFSSIGENSNRAQVPCAYCCEILDAEKKALFYKCREERSTVIPCCGKPECKHQSPGKLQYGFLVKGQYRKNKRKNSGSEPASKRVKKEDANRQRRQKPRSARRRSRKRKRDKNDPDEKDAKKKKRT